jgi:hypothetical protein
MSQTQDVLALLRTRGTVGLTSLEALRYVGSSRLAARIYELRRSGYVIDEQSERTPKGARVSRYILRETCRVCGSHHHVFCNRITESEQRALWGDK